MRVSGSEYQLGNTEPAFRNESSSLNLTTAQKQKAQSIFDSAYQQAQTLRDQMYEKRKTYWNSQKPMSDAEIDKLAAEGGELFAKYMQQPVWAKQDS